MKTGSTFRAVLGLVRLKSLAEAIVAEGMATRSGIGFVQRTVANFACDELANQLELCLKQIEKLETLISWHCERRWIITNLVGCRR
jgi:hypothetical protein